jgi:preprotein translocase subunit SecD
MKRTKALIKFWIIAGVTLVALVFTFLPIQGITTYRGVIGTIGARFDAESGGGMYAVYEARVPEKHSKASFSEKLKARMVQTELALRYESESAKTLYTDASVARQGGDRIRVEIPGVISVSPITELIENEIDLWFTDADDKDVMPASYIERVSITANQLTSSYELSIELDDDGVDALMEASGTLTVIDRAAKDRGASESSTYNTYKIAEIDLAEYTAGSRKITVAGLATEALNIAYYKLLAGARPLELKLVTADVVSSVDTEKTATLLLAGGIAAAVLLLVFFVLRYKGLGVLAGMSFLAFFVLLLLTAAVQPFGALTLTAAAAIVFGFALFAVSQIAAFGRLKEGYAQGKSFQASAASAYKQSFWTVFDIHLLTLVLGGALWLLGEGAVVGFAFVLILADVLSLLASTVLTRYLIRLTAAIYGDKLRPGLFGLHRRADVAQVAEETENV